MSIHAINLTNAAAAEDEAFHARYYVDRIMRTLADELRRWDGGGYTIEEMERLAAKHQNESARYYAMDRAKRGLTISD